MDRLDTLIRWTLQEGLRDVAPPPGLWDRIKEGGLQEVEPRRGSWRQGFRTVAETFALSVLASVSGARASSPYGTLVVGGSWKGECLCGVDEYGILLRRLAVL